MLSLSFFFPKLQVFLWHKVSAFFVLLNLDFSCDLSDRTNENMFGSYANQAIITLVKINFVKYHL